MRSTLQFNVLNPPLLADAALFVAASFGIDYENVRTHKVQCRQIVDDAASCIDEGVLDIAYALHHEEAFLLREHRLAMLVLQVGGIGAYSHIEIPEAGGLHEELHMPAMQQIITSADENFLLGHI